MTLFRSLSAVSPGEQSKGLIGLISQAGRDGPVPIFFHARTQNVALAAKRYVRRRATLRASPTLLVSVSLCESFFRSEEHTSELQSLMRISYAVFCLKKKKHTK